MSYLKYLIALIILAYIGSCATPSNPMGGPRDRQPPKLVYSKPYNQQLNYKSKEIILEFDEWIQFNNIKEQLIITPRLDVEWEYDQRKNKATIKFEKALDDSTTYTLNFREGIVDITEKNPWRNPILSFSTGPFIDTAFISGEVYNYWKDAPAKDAIVALYVANDTTDVLKHPPYYFTKTDSKGYFELQNLRKGRYRIYTFDDKNKNLILNPEKEDYGFYYEQLRLNDSLMNIKMHHQRFDVREPQIRSAVAKGRYFEVTYNKGLQDYEISAPGSFDLKTVAFGGNRSIRFFKPNNFNRDSLVTYITVTDTIGMQKIDTVYIKFRDSKLAPEDFKVTNSYGAGVKILNKVDFSITFTKPITYVNKDSIFIFVDSAIVLRFAEDEMKWNKHMTMVHFNKTFDIRDLERKKRQAEEERKQKKEQQAAADTSKADTQARTNKSSGPPPPFTFKINFNKGSFVSVEADTSKAQSINVGIKKQEDYGLIKGRIQTEHSHFIVQLLSSDLKVIEEIYNRNDYVFTYVPPGKYRIRVMLDLNKNGKWDPGDVQTNLLPEPIVYLKEELTVRANWELIDKNIDIPMDKYVDSHRKYME
jgi:hypothetical protein